MRVGVAALKANLSEHLARVKAGEEVLITERGRPIARIVPLAETALDAHVAELVRQGRVRPPRRPINKERLAKLLAQAPEDPEGFVLKALLAERREGR
jgi:prevent-host-death family protein